MKTYGQFCGLARALDVVGDRWSLLIIRELGIRPCRYGELREGLPGIATNLLAHRLRELEANGVVEVADDRGTKLYRLTERGRELRPSLISLARWGGADMARGRCGDTFQAPWLSPAVEAITLGVPLADLEPLRIRTVMPDSGVDVVVGRGQVHCTLEGTGAADVTVTADPETLLELFTGRATPGQVRRRPGCSVRGRSAAVRTLAELGRRSGAGLASAM